MLLPVIAGFLIWIVNKQSVLGKYKNTYDHQSLLADIRKQLEDAIIQQKSCFTDDAYIGYFSTQTDWNGRFRRVQVEAARSGAVARTRRGYYANP